MPYVKYNPNPDQFRKFFDRVVKGEVTSHSTEKELRLDSTKRQPLGRRVPLGRNLTYRTRAEMQESYKAMAKEKITRGYKKNPSRPKKRKTTAKPLSEPALKKTGSTALKSRLSS